MSYDLACILHGDRIAAGLAHHARRDALVAASAEAAQNEHAVITAAVERWLVERVRGGSIHDQIKLLLLSRPNKREDHAGDWLSPDLYERRRQALVGLLRACACGCNHVNGIDPVDLCLCGRHSLHAAVFDALLPWPERQALGRAVRSGQPPIYIDFERRRTLLDAALA